MTQRLNLLLLVAGLALYGCDDEKTSTPGKDGGPDATDDGMMPGEDGGDAGDDDIDVSTQELINKDTGGEIELEGAILEIEAGAMQIVGESLEITMSAKTPPDSLPDADSVVGLYYEFGPAGLQFDPPAKLKLPLPEDLGDNFPVVSFYNEETEAWEDLATSIEGDFLVAYIDHFSGYATRAVEAGQCLFEACGGNPAGYWSVTSICEAPDVDDYNPYSQVEACPGASTVVTKVMEEGAFSFFQGDGPSGFYVNLYGERTLVANIPATEGCYTGLDVSGCENFAERLAYDFEFETVTCAEANNTCSCTATGPDSDGFEGTWSVNGDTLTLTFGEESQEVPFCVSGAEDDSFAVHTGNGIIKAEASSPPS